MKCDKKGDPIVRVRPANLKDVIRIIETILDYMEEQERDDWECYAENPEDRPATHTYVDLMKLRKIMLHFKTHYRHGKRFISFK